MSSFSSEVEFTQNLASQLAMSPQTLTQLREFGVTDQTELRLEFFFYTDIEAHAEQLAEVLAERDYSVATGQSWSDDDLYVVTGWTTPLRMEEKTVAEWTELMCRLGFEHGCAFDGWGTTPEQ